MSSRWTEETTVKFVQEYRDKPCLWNTKISLYKNKQARDAALKIIQDNMGIEGFGVNEIKNKIKDSKKSGTGTESIYVPNVKWFIEMDSFLNNLEDNKRPPQDNLNNVHFEEVPDDNVTQVEEVLIASVPPPAKKIKATSSKLKEVSKMVQELKKISDIAVKEPEREHEYIVFGRSVAAQLMGLKTISAIRVQEQIQSVLTSFKVQDLQQKDNFAYNFPPYTSGYTDTTMQSPDDYNSSSLQSPTYTNYSDMPSEQINRESRTDLNSSGVNQNDILSEALGDALSNF